MEELHKPVLLEEVIRGLAPKVDESYLDLTAGYAGHASKILAAVRDYKSSVLVDRDEFAIKHLTTKYPDGEVVQPEHSDVHTLEEAKGLMIVKSDFYNAARLLIECGRKFDMILADFGVSSPQVDNSERGFSFLKPGPLDMRMDQTQSLTASDIVNKWSPRELERIFMEYGEESEGLAKKHARTIIEGRPWNDTKELADRIAYGKHQSKSKALAFSDETGKVESKKRFGKHPATQVFQAIRIAVNDELGIIERTLPLLPKLLNPGGRVAIITFHSLEDRLVKNYFREVSTLGQESELIQITKSPISAEKLELVINPRSRSAKLRIAMKPTNN
ncbi:MAG: 16S rRNA (cytosine(1402)-N(4))-methyltransferase RsmH [Candidatus Saccharibacteria bacterium]|nr:16S rRNA (cytosine(1402)-N(4))-methyltransferase RsmH [Candidatus Saccharibacteria bacterium]